MIGKLSAILQEEFANVKSCSKKKSALQSKSTEYHKAVKKFKVFYKSYIRKNDLILWLCP